MITCPRCGAENKDGATVCRMCATSLDSAAASAPPPAQQGQEIPATVLIPTPGGGSPAAAQGGSGKVLCPGCQATNDADWAFCQQCGTRLAQDQGQQPSYGAPPTVVAPSVGNAQNQQWGAPTVVTPTPDFNASQPSNPPAQQGGQGSYPPSGGAMPPSWGAPTVVTPAAPGAGSSQPPSPQGNPPPPQAGTPNANWGAPTVVTPMPDMNQGQQGMPPPNDSRMAATVITPIPPGADLSAYPETIVSQQQDQPSQQPNVGETVVEGSGGPAPAHSGGGTQDMSGGAPTASQPAPQAPPPSQQAPPGEDQRTIVMSSTPIASPPKAAKLYLIMEGGEVGETYKVKPAETVIGRVDGDIKFPHDGYMSSRHARILQRNGRFFLLDNNSRNGTFIKIHQEVELHPGDVVLVGKQLFRFEVDE